MKIMTKNEIIEQCLSEKGVPYGLLYNKLIPDLVAIIWQEKYPEYFIVCQSTGDRYRNCNKSPYKWYMLMRNSSFDPENKYKVDDCHKYELNCSVGKESAKKIIRERIKVIIDDILNTPDIRIYSIEHFG